MKLSDWAKSQGINYRTAWRWFKNGTLPVADVIESKAVSIYGRVSSADQSDQLRV